MMFVHNERSKKTFTDFILKLNGMFSYMVIIWINYYDTVSGFKSRRGILATVAHREVKIAQSQQTVKR